MTADPRAVLLRDIFDDPDDDLPRLVLGDWLADHGDPRGEFIQIDVRLAAGVKDKEERAGLEQRRREILAKHALSWLGPLVDVASEWEFRRGFVHLTLRGLSLSRRDGPSPLDSDAFAWVTGVRMRDLDFGRLRVTIAPRLTSLPTLELPDLRLGNEAVERLLKSCESNGLRHLDLGGNRIGDQGVTRLAGFQPFDRLHSLGLRNNSLGEAGALALMESPHLAGLRSLDLRGCRISPETKDELRHRFGQRVRL